MRRHQTELQRLRGLEKNAVVLSDRDALLGSAGGSGKGADAGAERATPGQLQTRIENEFKQQDEIIGNMSKGLDNLKSIGLAIRDETDLHMKLLDNLEDSVDKGNAALKRETARADHITAETRSCWLYMTICILLVVLIGLVRIPLELGDGPTKSRGWLRPHKSAQVLSPSFPSPSQHLYRSALDTHNYFFGVAAPSAAFSAAFCESEKGRGSSVFFPRQPFSPRSA